MNGYKCYLLSKKHLQVYGVITENHEGIGLKQLHIGNNGRLKDHAFLPPSYVHKSALEKWNIESTLDEDEAINFIINNKKDLKTNS